MLASSASRVPGLALASAAVGRWVAALASQHRDTHTSLKAAREKLTKQARASAALQATVEAMALERVCDCADVVALVCLRALTQLTQTQTSAVVGN